MHILLAHNRYQQTGGEDSAFAAEHSLLIQHGHTITEFLDDNRRIPSMNSLALAAQTVWSSSSNKQLSVLLKNDRPEVAYFFNTFPLISPSAYYACKEQSVPVVQGLHNYRLLCPSADFFRAGHVCEDCLGRTPPWPGVVHKCYHRSHAHTAVVATMITVHRLLRTWQRTVDCYIAPTEFLRNKYIEGGFPAEKIFVKPNFVPTDPGLREGAGEYAVYAGRLSPEKGIRTLIKSWRRMDNLPLKILGAGPLEPEIRSLIHQLGLKTIELLGQVSLSHVTSILKSARFLVFPSECYESFGLAIVEAFACGVPVIASRLGAMAELVSDGRTGLLFNPGDPDDLAAKVEWAWNHPKETDEMGNKARREYEDKYTADENYQNLMSIINQAINQNAGEPKDRLAA
jgi:glycosyltransferase involved in cell wall biosynthesis